MDSSIATASILFTIIVRVVQLDIYAYICLFAPAKAPGISITSTGDADRTLCSTSAWSALAEHAALKIDALPSR